MSAKLEIEVTGMNDDELVEGAKERQEFEGSASGEINYRDSIIANKVHTDKDQLFFLEKYTDRSANE